MQTFFSNKQKNWQETEQRKPTYFKPKRENAKELYSSGIKSSTMQTRA